MTIKHTTELPMHITYEYYAAEPEIPNGPNPQQGSGAYLELISIKIQGKECLVKLQQDAASFIDFIEQVCLDQIEGRE